MLPITLQETIQQWLQQLPGWWALINDGSHGVIGIVIAGIVIVWAFSMLYAGSRGSD